MTVVKVNGVSKQCAVITLPKQPEHALEQRLLKVVDQATNAELTAFWSAYLGKGFVLRKIAESDLLEARRAARICIRTALSAIGSEDGDLLIIRCDECVHYIAIDRPVLHKTFTQFALLPKRVHEEASRKKIQKPKTVKKNGIKKVGK